MEVERHMAKSERKTITERIVERLKPVTKDTWIMDSEVVGFGIRQQPNARPAYVIRWKDADSKDRKRTIAAVDQITLEEARGIAKQQFGMIAKGLNPADEETKSRTAKHTFSDLIELVLKEKAELGRAPKYLLDMKQQFRDHVEPTIGHLKVLDITPTDIDRVLSPLRGRAVHNRVLAALSSAFNRSIRWGYRANNPVLGAGRQHEEPRSRFMTDAEMDRLLQVLDARPGQSSDAARLLYLTGARPKELFSVRWRDLSIDEGQTPVWTKPSQYVKQKRSHVVELSSLAAAAFRRIRTEAGKDATPDAFVFPSRGKDGHLTTIKNHWKAVVKEAGIENVRPYDLRKAFATRILAAGTDIKTAMSLTGHTQVDIFMKHYAQLMPNKMGEALAKVQWVPSP